MYYGGIKVSPKRRKNSTRDNQRMKLYRAEWEADSVFREMNLLPLMSLQECREFISKVVHSRWWMMNGMRTPFNVAIYGEEMDVRDGRGRSSASAWNDVIKLPRDMRTRSTILHELAHVGTGYHTVAPHGVEFASNMLKLVKRWMGKEAHAILRQSFKEHKVHYIVRRAK